MKLTANFSTPNGMKNAKIGKDLVPLSVMDVAP